MSAPPESPAPKREPGEWKPQILGILCNWCSYAGADLAGGGRIQYPPDVRVVRVMCTGRVDALFVLKAMCGSSVSCVPGVLTHCSC